MKTSARWRTVAAVATAWLVVAIILALQNTLGASMRGEPITLASAFRGALVQTVPWIPVTLAVVYLSVRFPLARNRPMRFLIHIAAAVAVGFCANVMVVLGFWLMRGRFESVGVLIDQAMMWTMLRLHISFVIYAIIAALTHGLIYYQASRERELHTARLESQLARARLQALNAQIRPHFLFNTLHTIGQLWRSGRSDEADAVLDHLGNLFQKVQTVTNRAEVTLGEELVLVREYLAIEQVRFSDRLRPSVSVPESAEDCLVPPLILQPLVENAVRHGISRKSSSGRIDVSAFLQNGTLTLRISDDGAGFTAENRNGTGLSNTRERLQQLYGSAGKMDISSGESGTIVTLTLPAHQTGVMSAELMHG